jgi:hypothetical protein
MINCKDLHQYNTFAHIVFLYLNICLGYFIAFIFLFIGVFAYLRNIVLKLVEEKNLRNIHY